MGLFCKGTIMEKKQRLDKLVQEKFPHLTRNQVQGFIMQGKVKVDGEVSTKAGHATYVDKEITLDADQPKYVCRAGFKLEKALEHFGIDVSGKVIMDAGLSTGGFTDCLLQNGAKRVYGVDVGYGQVHEKIRNNDKVEVLERTNLRHLKTVGELVDIVTLDLSFISVLKVMEAVVALMKPQARLIVLVKPQFEAKREQVGRGGIIKDDKIHQEVIEKVTSGIGEFGFSFCGITESPIKGATGNTEFLAFFEKE
jgi:23S rRNA (cytidine1920-2'-O)/16S rRNA (cytidine1409-2'-O)-methyltransferase